MVERKLRSIQINGKVSYVHGSGDLIVLTWPCRPEQINRFGAIPIKISVAFFKEMERKHSEFMWGVLTLNCRNRLEVGKKETAGGLTPLAFKTRYEATVIQTVRH